LRPVVDHEGQERRVPREGCVDVFETDMRALHLRTGFDAAFSKRALGVFLVLACLIQ
jgi:hypothetical protein